MNADNVNTDEDDNDVSSSVVAVSNSISFTAINLRPQESSITRFLDCMATTKLKLYGQIYCLFSI